MSRETMVYRPNDPRANQNGMVPKHLAAPLAVVHGTAPMVISDLEPYRPAAAEKHTGKRPVIGGRRQHREFLSRNGYVELGNDMPTPRHEQLSQTDRIADLKRALGE